MVSNKIFLRTRLLPFNNNSEYIFTTYERNQMSVQIELKNLKRVKICSHHGRDLICSCFHRPQTSVREVSLLIHESPLINKSMYNIFGILVGNPVSWRPCNIDTADIRLAYPLTFFQLFKYHIN